MQVLIFKTNIRSKRNVEKIQQHITVQPQIIKWNIDLKDVDKILRIETDGLQPQKVVQLVNNAGYYCEELPD